MATPSARCGSARMARVVALLWGVAGVLALSHSALQYINVAGMSARPGGFLQKQRSVGVEMQAKNDVRAPAARDSVDASPKDTNYFGSNTSYYGAGIVAALVGLGTFSATSGPVGLAKYAPNPDSDAMSRAVRELKIIQFEVDRETNPAALEKKTRQRILTAGTAIGVPLGLAALALKFKIPNPGKAWEKEGDKTFRVGGVYEARDETSVWWPVRVQSMNPDGSYACCVCAIGAQVDASVTGAWGQVWPSHMRLLTQEDLVPKEMKQFITADCHEARS